MDLAQAAISTFVTITVIIVLLAGVFKIFQIASDLGETTDVASQHPGEVKRLEAYAEQARAELGDALTKRKGAGVREPARLPDPKAGP